MIVLKIEKSRFAAAKDGASSQLQRFKSSSLGSVGNRDCNGVSKTWREERRGRKKKEEQFPSGIISAMVLR
jgi:hypothetical protein